MDYKNMKNEIKYQFGRNRFIDKEIINHLDIE